MQIYQFDSISADKQIAAILNRSLSFRKKDYQRVERILEEVRQKGDQALIDYTRQFDSPNISREALRVGKEEIQAAAQQVDKSFMRAMNRAIRQIDAFHRQQLQKSWIDNREPGKILGQLVNPVDAVGIYVPGGQGGQTPLVSSVLMGAIPAKIAGVTKIVMITPPTQTGTINPHLLAAAHKLKLDAVYKVGSAWGIAALAYGTDTIPKVDVIVGPGNIYVTLAKKIVAGTVGIDIIAGPSEILIIADHTANPDFAAADLLSQAEHDTLSSAILITDDAQMATAVQKAVDKALVRLSRRSIAEESLRRFGAIVVVSDMDAAFMLANRIAPEHLELQIANPFEYLAQIRNAGAVFIGPYTPEPVGDYIAGPSHVLPTAGTARFASALSVDHFIKKTSLIHYSKAVFKKEAGDIIRLAEIEGLDAHAQSVKVRLNQ